MPAGQTADHPGQNQAWCAACHNFPGQMHSRTSRRRSPLHRLICLQGSSKSCQLHLSQQATFILAFCAHEMGISAPRGTQKAASVSLMVRELEWTEATETTSCSWQLVPLQPQEPSHASFLEGLINHRVDQSSGSEVIRPRRKALFATLQRHARTAALWLPLDRKMLKHLPAEE